MVRRSVAPLLQLGAGFHPELSGRENVFLYGAMLGMRRAETASCLDEIIDFAELRSFIDAPLRTYSSGMEARLGFAVATVKRPDVLLIDEVLAVGDEEFKAKCGARMREFSARGTTLVLVTHDAQLVLSECTRAIWLESGGLRAEGTPADILGAYHAFLETRGSAARAVDVH